MITSCGEPGASHGDAIRLAASTASSETQTTKDNGGHVSPAAPESSSTPDGSFVGSG